MQTKNIQYTVAQGEFKHESTFNNAPLPLSLGFVSTVL